MSIRPRTKSNYRKEKDPSRGQNLDYNSWMTDVEKTFFETLIFKYVYFDTMIDVTMKKREQRIGMWYFQYWERRSVRNPKINWKENSRVRIGRIAFTAEASNLQIGRYSCNPKTINGLFNQEWGITQKKSLQKYNSSIPWIVPEIITLLQKLDWNCTGGVHIRTEERQTFPLQWGMYNLFRQQCQRSRSNYRYKEIEEGESSSSLTTGAKCKRLNLLVRNAETKFGRQSLSKHYVPVSTLEGCVVKVVKQNREENYSQEKLRLERTRCNPPKYLRAQEFRRFKHAPGNRE